MNLSVVSCLCLVLISCDLGKSDVTVVSRAGWGAQAPSSTLSNLAVPVTYVVIHHTETPECQSTTACSARVRSIQNYHMTPKPNGKGWWDIGYNFLIGGDGKAYEGRGWDKRGAHAGSYNGMSIGIAMIGSFTNGLPNQAARDALNDLIALGRQNGKLRTNYIVKGHRDVSSTSCPGNNFYNNFVTSMTNYQS